jgi:hypothetical protein
VGDWLGLEAVDLDDVSLKPIEFALNQGMAVRGALMLRRSRRWIQTARAG